MEEPDEEWEQDSADDSDYVPKENEVNVLEDELEEEFDEKFVNLKEEPAEELEQEQGGPDGSGLDRPEHEHMDGLEDEEVAEQVFKSEDGPVKDSVYEPAAVKKSAKSRKRTRIQDKHNKIAKEAAAAAVDKQRR